MLKDKVAVITGSSSGIGKEIAHTFAKNGAKVVVNYPFERSAAEAEAVVEEIKSNGGEAIAVMADVSNFEQAKELMKIAVDTFGALDILVNNAGITRDMLLLRMTEEEFDNVININLKGVFNCMKAITPVMVRQKQGKIISISSVVGIAGNAGQVNYSASKAGIIGMTKSLAKELGSRGVNVNAVAPGFIETDMTDVLGDRFKEEAKKSIPLKRLGKAEDVAEVVAFLASDSANYITGQVIHVDGGMVM